MKSLAAAVTAALLLCGTAAVRAAEPIPAPVPLKDAGPSPAGPAGPACSACGSCGSTCGGGCCQGGPSGKLLAWLSYAPLHRARCGECNTCCAGCLPPLYLYFLGSCQEHNCASCGCGNGCGGHACH
jgi:hypothetical protein